MDERREGRQFGQLLREGVGRAVSEMESFPKRFVSLLARDPVNSALLGTATLIFLYTFGFAEGAEAARDYIFPRLVKGVAIGFAVSIPLAALVACSSRPQS